MTAYVPAHHLTMMNVYHEPALVEKVLHYLITQPEGVYVDGTVGGGGHAEAVLTKISPRGKLVGMDIDCDALMFARRRLNRFGDRVTLLHENYTNMTKALPAIGINAVNGLLLDLGVSMRQLNRAERGFSFQSDNKIDMRMDQSQTLDGWTILNTYDESRLKDILQKYGEERYAGRIARLLIKARCRGPIDTTTQLAGVVRSAVTGRYSIKTVARVFQAIRIEVNRELQNLENVLDRALDFLIPGGRIVVISYHSLEDRIVKKFFNKESKSYVPSRNKLEPDTPYEPKLAVLTKKPVTASKPEISQNPQLRSAKLRSAERI